MQKIFLILLCVPFFVVAQQKVPLNHSVYDSWESIGEKYISNNGTIVVYTINVQEGDGRLVIQKTSGEILQTVPRGYNATICEDDKFVVFKIKPTFKETRDAKIAKKKADDLPKDSLGIYDIAKNKLEKIERVKSYKMPEKAGGWLAYLLEKKLPEIKENKEADSATTKRNLDNRIARLQREIDSLQQKNNELLANGFEAFKPKKESNTTPKKEQEFEEGTELVLRNLSDGKERKINLVQEYYFDKTARNILFETTKQKGNNKLKTQICVLSLQLNRIDTILLAFEDAKQYAFNENGIKLAFVASFDTTKAEQKNYNIYTSFLVLHKNDLNRFASNAEQIQTQNIQTSKIRINENAPLSFSKSGNRLFFGTSPILPAKDTSLQEFERVSVDVWNYNDEDLMTVQLKQVDARLRRGFTAMYDDSKGMTTQLGNDNFRVVRTTLEGDGKYFYTESDSGYRVAAQWQGFTYKDVFVLNSFTNETKKIATKVRANIYPSYTGKYLLMYDEDKKRYSCYNAETNTTIPVAKDIPYPLFDEENDMPDAPNNYGIVKWMEEDKYVLIYDKYDVWMVDPTGKEKSISLTSGRKDKIEYRYVTVDNEEKVVKQGQEQFFRRFNKDSKESDFCFRKLVNGEYESRFNLKNIGISSNLVKAKDSFKFIFQKESFAKSSNLFVYSPVDVQFVMDLDGKPIVDRLFNKHDYWDGEFFSDWQLTNLNPQQSSYNWGTSELFKWKAYTGKLTEGIVYKPENFDSTKKYPMIVYFYERNNQTLHNYRAPSPTASALNIPYFVSNGYVVFVPDIWYKTGYPGQSAYDYIVSGTRALVKKGFIDSTKIGLQGQSWGGYQIAYLITQTNLYKAAWAGAPVANMFSAYGGIRWGTGLNRQFQYEHSQSRIGATPWQKPELYIKNSPLFHLPKVTTPLVIMHNDADDAVPWYQGIELFTAMRRLNKKVWMLNYNGEAHNLIERKNRKDIQQKQAEFFDYMLKGAAPAKWISEGIPAVMKGRKAGV